MPSLLHEALLELFRNRPVLAAEILHEALSVPLPRFTEARVESADLVDVVPRELRADLLVLLLDDRPVLVIVVEVQLSDDADKSFAWPAYVAGARARYRCPACLLVVTPDTALAARLARPIVLGPGENRLTPFVVGPRGIPVVTEISAARERPELAVLSAMAHGRTDVGLDVAIAALEASAGIVKPEQRGLYWDFVVSSLGEATRRAIEAYMIRNYEYQSEFARTYIAKGREEGRQEGSLLAITHLFERRLVRSLDDDEKQRLADRLRKDGADRLMDMALDLSPEALAGLLAPPNGH